jgi:NADH-quinone oxidoreductase subunit C/D
MAASTTVTQDAPEKAPVAQELRERFGEGIVAVQETRDDVPTLWVERDRLKEIVRYLKHDAAQPYKLLYDLCGVDERVDMHRTGMPPSDFTVVYHLLSFERNSDVRLKVALKGNTPSMPTITDVWESANWYEREAWDMYGIKFDGHPNLRRILMPTTWVGHPCARTTPRAPRSCRPTSCPMTRWIASRTRCSSARKNGASRRRSDDSDVMFLNLGRTTRAPTGCCA